MSYYAVRLQRALQNAPVLGKFHRTAASILLSQTVSRSIATLSETYLQLYDRKISADIDRLVNLYVNK